MIWREVVTGNNRQHRRASTCSRQLPPSLDAPISKVTAIVDPVQRPSIYKCIKLETDYQQRWEVQVHSSDKAPPTFSLAARPHTSAFHLSRQRIEPSTRPRPRRRHPGCLSLQRRPLCHQLQHRFSLFISLLCTIRTRSRVPLSTDAG